MQTCQSPIRCWGVRRQEGHLTATLRFTFKWSRITERHFVEFQFRKLFISAACFHLICVSYATRRVLSALWAPTHLRLCVFLYIYQFTISPAAWKHGSANYPHNRGSCRSSDNSKWKENLSPSKENTPWTETTGFSTLAFSPPTDRRQI